MIRIRKYQALMLLSFLVAGLTSGSRCQPPESPSIIDYALLAGSKVTVKGATNVNQFQCLSSEASTGKTLMITISDASNIIRITDGEIKIPTNTLDCGNSVMNANMYRLLDNDRFPHLLINVEEIFPFDPQALNSNQVVKLQANAQVSIGVRKLPQQIKFNCVRSEPGVFRIWGVHSMTLTSFDIEPPCTLFGLVKVKDQIVVVFDLWLRLLPQNE